MARRAVIDREELFQAAEEMAMAGKEVTALSLLNTLGGGSLTTIYKYLAEWEAGRPKTVPALAAEMPDPVKGVFAAAWRTAQAEAARETEAIKQKSAEEVATAKKLFDGALEAIQKLEAESEQDAAQIESLKARVSELEEQLSESRREGAALAATGEQLAQQVKSQQAEVERLHKTMEEERQRHHDELVRAQTDRETAIKEAAELKGQADTLKSQNAELMKKLAPPKKGE